MTEKLNVLSITYGRELFQTGTTNRNRVLACSEACQSYHVIVFTLRKHNLQVQKVNEKLTFHPTNARTRIGMVIKAVIIGLSILRQYKPGEPWVIRAHDLFECGLVGFILRLKTKVPLNVQMRSDFFSHPYWRREQLFNRVRWLFGLWLLPRADSVRVVAKRIVEDLLKRGIKSDRLHLLPTTINVADFTLTSPRRFDRQTINIIGVARFVAQKNFPLLIEAFNLATAEVPNLRLTIVGSGPEEKLISSLVEKNKDKDKITILPWSDDIPSLFEASDIYALSSNFEGRARVLVEAMASGLPIVSTDISGVSDVCEPGVHALIVAPRNPKAFANALVTLAKDREMRERFSRASTQAAQKSTQDMSQYVADWVKILNQTISS